MAVAPAEASATKEITMNITYAECPLCGALHDDGGAMLFDALTYGKYKKVLGFEIPELKNRKAYLCFNQKVLA